MDIRTLRYFVEVVRQQSFTRAAEKLFVTQPTISKMLKNLEDELNCTLLIRDGRKLLLTDTGRVVFERGLAILGEFRQLESELSDINHLHKGLLRLGIPPMVGMMMAGPISLFRQRYPGIELKVSEFGGLTVQQAVVNGELDIAVTALPVDEESGLSTLPLFNHPLCVLVPRTGDWMKIDSVSPELLAAHPLLIYNEEFSLSRQLMQMFNRHHLKPRIAVRSGQWDFLAAMVQAGVGVAILPQPICERLDKNTLRWIPLESDLRWELGLTWREGVYLSHSAQAWLTCCKGFWTPAA
ncbi:MAG: LysR family transcriptional regulator [Yokenella regensburgei]|jgi:DNA-binding transcriptional LysR family regulator|uniref:DNA-binding transcriptional LysR family regulator n=1 Tax=Yokenella regensburgei TaxID=158877 RepID=A0AB38FXW3_9ENTR|nr:LysR family transcriptional regulator [Yokenella regensburgei]EHM51765.1 LysR substrate binding domain protein [Yokenella regensburgei ATCC 43003]KAF1370497.1 DNA-binding transcriptional LysR family regulator [Yokenella regensburgei]KFD25120.1 LysR family regulatory protein [Yokenella regensburgei ATCC 49455]MDQ4429692.1 LysR family transcriptional regulator [Yokenella regensburgei]MDR2217239.1 LysR family transcriptional regulator [Yokenella regensburgei]